MKRLWLTVMVIMTVALFAGTSQAYSIKMYDASSGNYQINGLTGGPFRANVLSPVPTGMIGTAIPGGIEFLTFCMESNEVFSYNTAYAFTLDTFAAAGGAGGATAGKDPLDPRTAYLYYNFRMNESAYDNDHRMALQAAFWHIEDEIYLPSSNRTTVQQYAWDYVYSLSGNWSNIGPVMVMNIMDGNNNRKQSQLALVPEPTTMFLLGLGLVGIAGLRRKFF